MSFSDLPPGDYHFRIKAEDYLLESDTDEITIHIAPAWWASGWAMLIYALLAVTAVYGIILQVRHRYRIRQEMMQHIHAEQINEAKLQFFHQHLPRDTYSDVAHHQSFAKTDDKRYRPRTAKELPHHLAQFRKNPSACKPIDGYTQDRQRADVTRFP